MTEVALVVAIGEPGCDFPQVSLPDRLTAQRTEGLWARCPAIDQNELHAVSLSTYERALILGHLLSKPVELTDLPLTRNLQDRSNVGVLFTPSRARAAHVVQLGSIGIENFPP